METRRRRGDVALHKGYVVTARDEEILHAIGRMKLAQTRQLTALFFGDRSVAARRLRKLAALRLVQAFAPRLQGDNLYALTERGRERLIDAGVPAEDLHAARRVTEADPRHLVAINNVRVALVQMTRDVLGVRLDLFRADWDLRRVAGLALPEYVPDALVKFTTATGEARIALEVDLMTETAAQFRRKARLTVAMARAAQPCWGLAPGWRSVVLTTSPRRLQTLARAVAEEGGGSLWFGGLLAEPPTLMSLAALVAGRSPDEARLHLADLAEAGAPTACPPAGAGTSA